MLQGFEKSWRQLIHRNSKNWYGELITNFNNHRGNYRKSIFMRYWKRL